jgi:hypothetical protein
MMNIVGQRLDKIAGQKTWQGDGVEKRQVVGDELKSQNTFQRVSNPIWEYKIPLTKNMFKYA